MKDSGNLRKLWRLPWRALGFDLHEASELAAVLEEAAPDTIFFDADEKEALRNALSSRSHAPSSFFGKRSLHDRMRMAMPQCIDEGSVDWSRLSEAISTESLSAASMGPSSAAGGSRNNKGAAVQLELNSGGRVFFLIFRSPEGVLAGPESLAVIKLAPSRLLMQAEQFANELTRHLGICAPSCRIVRQAGATSTEWQAVVDAVARLGDKADGLDGELAALPCLLLMQFVRGKPLLEVADAFEGMHVTALFEDLGRLFLLDMVLGNADRLPCIDLGWRGNPNNIMLGARGTEFAGRAVAIDSCVQRRPPAARLSHEDAAVDKLCQLLLNDAAFALAMLRGGLMAGSRSAVTALAARPAAYVAAFQHGFRSCLEKVVAIKGLLEMIHQKMSEWVLEFLTDIREHKPQLNLQGATPGAPASGGGRPMRRPFSAAPAGASPAAHSSPQLPNPLKANADDSSPADNTQQERMRPASQPSRSLCMERLAPLSSTPRDRSASHAGTQPLPEDEPAAVHDEGCVTPATASSSQQQPFSASGSDSGGLKTRRSLSGTTHGTPRSRPQSSTPPSRRVTLDGDSDVLSQATSSPQPPTIVPPVAQDAISYYQGKGQQNLNLTLALKAVRTEAKHDDIVSERMQHWAQVFRERGAELRQAVDEWQARNGVERGILTTGFLDGTHPIVDTYELKVRLDHMLRRLRVLEEAAAARAPAKVLPGLFVGGAVSADSHYVLRHLAITHIVNATQEVLPPPEKAGFKVLVVPLRDTDDEEIAEHFRAVNEFIEEARGRPPKTPPPDPLLMLQQAPPTRPALPHCRPQPPPAPTQQEQPRTPERRVTPVAGLPPMAGGASPFARGAVLPITTSPILSNRSRFSDGGSSPTRSSTPDRRLLKRHPSAADGPLSPVLSEPSPPMDRAAGSSSPNLNRPLRAGGSPNQAATSGVLVHCSEGKSRSVTLVLNYLMQVQGWTLKEALLHVRRCRPVACPNAGFLAKLVELDVQLHGRASLRPGDEGLGLKRGKPEPRVCPVCSAKVGVSTASLAVHMKAKHPEAVLRQAA